MSTDSTYHGSCHCGSVKYSVSLPADPTSWTLSRCNCTVCHKKGYLSLSPKDVTTFTLLSPPAIDQVGDYTYGSGAIHHRFCKTCGTSVFARGVIPALGGDYVMVNVNTLDEVDLSKISDKKAYWNGLEEKWAEGPKKEPVAPGQW